MLETFSPISSSFFLDVNISVPYSEEICCPIPRRPVSTTHVYVSWASSKKRRRSSSNSVSNTRKETDWEATQELQEILLSQIPLDSSFDEEESESESETDVTNDSSSQSSLFGIPQLTSFDPVCSPVKVRKDSNHFMCDAFIEAVCTESLLSFSERDSFRNSGSEDFSSLFMPRGPKAQRPKLGTSNRPELGNSTSNLSEATFVNERSKPVITPPVRVHNPLPRNSSFTNRKAGATQGPEFGLLSVSPPRADDEETLLRRARVKSKKKPDAFKNEPHPKRENFYDPFPSAIVNSDVIGNVCETARTIDVDL